MENLYEFLRVDGDEVFGGHCMMLGDLSDIVVVSDGKKMG